MPWVDWPIEGLFDCVLDGLSVLPPDCVPLMLPPLFSPLFSCVADGDLLESPICDWAAAIPPNPTTAATATVANSCFLISLSSVLPQSQAPRFAPAKCRYSTLPCALRPNAGATNAFRKVP